MYRSVLTEEVAPSLARAAALESPVGLVSRCAELAPAPGEPAFSIWTGLLDDPSAALRSQRTWNHRPESGNFDGAGGAIDPRLARHIAIVESLERYSSCSWAEEELIWDTPAGLGDAAVGPDCWPACSPTELADPRCGLIASDPRVPLRWVRGWSLTRGREVFVPAILVYLNFPVRTPSERFTNPVSTGTAAHSDLREAVLGGLLEVVERDAIALTWLQRLRLPEVVVDIGDLGPDVAEYHRVGTSTELTVHLRDATTDYGMRHVFDFLLDGPRPAHRLADTGAAAVRNRRADPLERVVHALEKVGSEAIVVDITTDEARQVGMHVVKALIPQAVPLSFSQHARYLATPRLYEAPRAMGLTVHDEADINPVRQPFA